jgi:hypothetical protein
MTSFVERELEALEAIFGSVRAKAIALLKASIDDVVRDIEAHGVEEVEGTVLAMGSATPPLP